MLCKRDLPVRATLVLPGQPIMLTSMHDTVALVSDVLDRSLSLELETAPRTIDRNPHRLPVGHGMAVQHLGEIVVGNDIVGLKICEEVEYPILNGHDGLHSYSFLGVDAVASNTRWLPVVPMLRFATRGRALRF